MDITVERNAFGRQVDSFEIDLPVPFFEDGQITPTMPFLSGRRSSNL
jgi:glutamine amidotransferase PdxT